MAEVKEITVNVSKKIGLPNYSSDMISASCTVTVDNDDFKTAFNKGWEICIAEIDAQMIKYAEPAKTTTPAPAQPKVYSPNPEAGEADWLEHGKSV